MDKDYLSSTEDGENILNQNNIPPLTKSTPRKRFRYSLPKKKKPEEIRPPKYRKPVAISRQHHGYQSDSSDTQDQQIAFLDDEDEEGDPDFDPRQID